MAKKKKGATPRKKKAAKKGGRGRKECPACHKQIGARSETCKECGHKFTIKAAKASTRSARASKGSDLTKALQAERARLEAKLVAVQTLLEAD